MIPGSEPRVPHSAGRGVLPAPVRRAGRWALLATVALPAALALPVAGEAQEVADRLRSLAGENARLYARPVTSGLGAAMNSGWFQGAGPPDFPGFSLDLRLMGALVPEDDEDFAPVLPSSVTVEVAGESRTYTDPYGSSTSVTTPTAAGSGAGATLEPRGQLREDLEEAGLDPSEFALRFPDGLDLPGVPMVAPQASLALPLGTEVAARWIPSLQVTGEVGEVEGYGVGASHSLSAWLLDGFPLDVAISGGVQRFEAGDYLRADSRTIQLTVSKTLSILTLYAGGGVEDSETRVSYLLEDPRLPGSGTRIEFRDRGANDRRFTVGLSLDVLFLDFAADFTSAAYDAVHASVGLGI